MATGFELTFRSELAASADEVWAHACTMEGVNEELAPWVRMTVPQEARGMSLADAPIGEELFGSWLLAGGLVPFDLHRLRLVEVGPNRRFLERSSSWMQDVWEHERWVEERDDGCVLTDRLRVVPRLSFLSPVARRVVSAIFDRRHRTLRTRFG